MITASLHENNRLIRKTILRVYPGSFAANLTVNVAMMVDTLLAGAILGQQAIAAVAIGLPAIGIFQSLLQTLVNGAGIKMAVHAGRGDRKKLNGTYSLGLIEYGVYAQTVKNNPDISAEDKKYIFEQLMANFQGECSEVGMYLCMARIAHREGYPEIGLYWEKAAWEDAEHAAKFAELLGEDLEPNMKATTKDNLAWRVDCEFGATQGKFDLAACAKKNGLDAIHDTVHEMARDEARHGKALEGMLKRYFK